jgi:hypothetical protein
MSSGINDLHNANFIFISPNPNSGNFDIQFSDNTIFKNMSLKIYNSLGKLVYSEQTESSQNLRLNLKLTSGLYMLELNGNNKRAYKKMVVD